MESVTLIFVVLNLAPPTNFHLIFQQTERGELLPDKRQHSEFKFDSCLVMTTTQFGPDDKRNQTCNTVVGRAFGTWAFWDFKRLHLLIHHHVTITQTTNNTQNCLQREAVRVLRVYYLILNLCYALTFTGGSWGAGSFAPGPLTVLILATRLC